MNAAFDTFKQPSDDQSKPANDSSTSQVASRILADLSSDMAAKAAPAPAQTKDKNTTDQSPETSLNTAKALPNLQLDWKGFALAASKDSSGQVKDASKDSNKEANAGKAETDANGVKSFYLNGSKWTRVHGKENVWEDQFHRKMEAKVELDDRKHLKITREREGGCSVITDISPNNETKVIGKDASGNVSYELGCDSKGKSVYYKASNGVEITDKDNNKHSKELLSKLKTDKDGNLVKEENGRAVTLTPSGDQTVSGKSKPWDNKTRFGITVHPADGDKQVVDIADPNGVKSSVEIDADKNIKAARLRYKDGTDGKDGESTISKREDGKLVYTDKDGKQIPLKEAKLEKNGAVTMITDDGKKISIKADGSIAEFKNHDGKWLATKLNDANGNEFKYEWGGRDTKSPTHMSMQGPLTGNKLLELDKDPALGYRVRMNGQDQPGPFTFSAGVSVGVSAGLIVQGSEAISVSESLSHQQRCGLSVNADGEPTIEYEASTVEGRGTLFTYKLRMNTDGTSLGEENSIGGCRTNYFGKNGELKNTETTPYYVDIKGPTDPGVGKELPENKVENPPLEKDWALTKKQSLNEFLKDHLKNDSPMDLPGGTGTRTIETDQGKVAVRFEDGVAREVILQKPDGSTARMRQTSNGGLLIEEFNKEGGLEKATPPAGKTYQSALLDEVSDPTLSAERRLESARILMDDPKSGATPQDRIKCLQGLGVELCSASPADRLAIAKFLIDGNHAVDTPEGRAAQAVGLSTIYDIASHSSIFNMAKQGQLGVAQEAEKLFSQFTPAQKSTVMNSLSKAWQEDLNNTEQKRIQNSENRRKLLAEHPEIKTYAKLYEERTGKKFDMPYPETPDMKPDPEKCERALKEIVQLYKSGDQSAKSKAELIDAYITASKVLDPRTSEKLLKQVGELVKDAARNLIENPAKDGDPRQEPLRKLLSGEGGEQMQLDVAKLVFEKADPKQDRQLQFSALKALATLMIMSSDSKIKAEAKQLHLNETQKIAPGAAA